MRSFSFVRFFLSVGVVTAAASLASCSSGKQSAKHGDGGIDYGTGINDTGQGAGTGTDTGLPCAVQEVFENRCIGCHLRNSKMPLLTYDDLMKPAPSDPSQNMAHKAVERMKSTTNPMPPPPAERATYNETATIEGWVEQGAPRGESCTPPATGGTSGGSYDTPLVCTSGKTWTGGDQKSSLMHPGGPCITCHAIRGGPAFTIAGTVFPTAHEPNDCNGADGVAKTLSVRLVDANGGVIAMDVNAAGNFYSYEEIFPPYQVRIFDGTNDRLMGAPLTAGDCNTCHTEKGANGAPGRIMAP